ncbi:adhesive domain-containing protein, partial [Weissella paramesenteroides]|uniref:adhesive domain-containing protein n=1 Tax=Weissella paramesenteroides TaxID=1249 RepID=UPI00388DEC44
MKNVEKTVVNTVQRKRMYKAKKLWVVAGVTGLTFGGVILSDNGISIDRNGLQISRQVASAAVISGELLSNVQGGNDSGSSTSMPLDNTKDNNVNFTLSGGALADASVVDSDNKVVALAVPDNLVGKVSPNGDASIDTAVTIRLNKVPLLQTLVTATNNLGSALTGLVDSTTGSLVGIDLNTQAVFDQLDALNSLLNTGQGNFTSTIHVSSDGTYLYADLNDGLGNVLAQNLTNILQNLKNAVNGLTATATNPLNPVTVGTAATINTTLAPLKLAVNTTINGLQAVLGPTGNLVSQLADAAVLGDTTITLPTTISANTSTDEQVFVGTVVNSDFIDINLLKTANGSSSVFFGSATPDTDAPAAPVVSGVTGNTTDGYQVVGTAEPDSTVTIKDPAGNVVGTGTADGDGNFTIDVPGTVGAGVDLDVTATDAAGNVSAPTTATTPADPTTPDTDAPAAPVVSGVTGNTTDGYQVVGTAEPDSTVTIKDPAGNVVGTG